MLRQQHMKERTRRMCLFEEPLLAADPLLLRDDDDGVVL